MNKSSRLSGFYQLSCEERASMVAEWAELNPDERRALQTGLSLGQAGFMIENVIGLFALPLGIATNFCIKDEDLLVPMAVEEPSIVAAVSFAARLARAGGGFRTGSSESVMIGQVQMLDLPRHDLARAAAAVRAAEADILAVANDLHPSIQARGGGARGLEIRPLADTRAGPMLIVHLLFDTCDAMGANAVNTAAEAIAPLLETLTGGRALLRILSNLSDQRQAWAEVTIPVQALATAELTGARVAQGIVEANAFAVADPYRAATHNKGIMNGIDAVALATGNDWRALEAGAHAYAAAVGSIARSLIGSWCHHRARRLKPSYTDACKCRWPWASWAAPPSPTPRRRWRSRSWDSPARAGWLRSWWPSDWRRTWQPSAPWSRTVFSAGTWLCMRAKLRWRPARRVTRSTPSPSNWCAKDKSGRRGQKNSYGRWVTSARLRTVTVIRGNSYVDETKTTGRHCWLWRLRTALSPAGNRGVARVDRWRRRRADQREGSARPG